MHNYAYILYIYIQSLTFHGMGDSGLETPTGPQGFRVSDLAVELEPRRHDFGVISLPPRYKRTGVRKIGGNR